MCSIRFYSIPAYYLKKFTMSKWNLSYMRKIGLRMRWCRMRLKNIKISNYRCFKEAEIDFDDHITLVVGKNGAGKTAILDAVAVSVSTFLLCIQTSGSIIRNQRKNQRFISCHDLILCFLCKSCQFTRIFDSCLATFRIQRTNPFHILLVQAITSTLDTYRKLRSPIKCKNQDFCALIISSVTWERVVQ